jgi:phage FluMu gp28-like protein
MKLKDGDYELVDGAAWLAVRGFAVRIFSGNNGIDVRIYKNGAEDEGAIAATFAADSELEGL